MSATNTPILSLHTEKLSRGISFPMVEIPSGRFRMGDDDGSGYFLSPKPAHQVELDTFWLGQYPITQALWQKVMGENPSYFKGSLRPVEQVSWEDTQVFLQRLNQQLGLDGAQVYRLPTEAEWEYAARGGIYSHHYKYSGSEQLGEVGWHRENSHSQTHPVGLLLPNELGLYDMSGNVWEWCNDWYGSDYYQQCHQAGIVHNPTGPVSGQDRVLRGGSWNYVASHCRVANRYLLIPDYRINYVGLRLARTAS